MASKIETSYGARIGNAEKLVSCLNGFGNYQAQRPELDIPAFTTAIANLKTKNNVIASLKQTNSLAIETRKLLFEKDDLSINKLLAPINATVKVAYGRASKEAKDVASIIVKLRGSKKNTTTTPTTTTPAVSQSYQSYSAKTQFFDDLIVNLNNFGTNYNPSNNDILITQLKTLHTNATAANNEVMNTYTQFIQNNETRILDYNALSQTAIKIKDSIKVQYGVSSAQYKLVKGLKI